MSLNELLREVRACTVCQAALPLGARPVVQAAPTARLLIVGQAPGRRVHETGVAWNDASGDRLREWLRIDPATFYDAARVAIVPMGFCYPGAEESGGDRPPRRECAPLWHASLLGHLRDIGCTLLVGQYAQRHYLRATRRQTMTETVRSFADYGPQFFPLPHPSWRSVPWMRQNRWFETRVLPRLREVVRTLV
jgi:uracil-DNA glycosylase